MEVGLKKIKPKKNLIVRDPHTMAILPESGTVISWTGPEGRYWRRRLRDGSIEIIESDEVKIEIKKKIKEDK